MLGGRFRKADLEIRLNWEPRSYWMPIEDEPVSTDSIGSQLGDSKGWDVVYARMLVERDSIMFTSHGAHLGCAYCSSLTCIGRMVHAHWHS